ncbi:MAG: roadblock/LC7 domain-containing protein [Acidobacteriota bacterium]
MSGLGLRQSRAPLILESGRQITYDLSEAQTEVERPLVSIDSRLEKLVSQVEGATGAILLEADGEAVLWYPVANSDRLRLRAAYAAVVLKSCRAAAIPAKLRGLKSLVMEYDCATLVVQGIDGDYFALVELGPSANIGQALFRLDRAVNELRGEIAR